MRSILTENESVSTRNGTRRERTKGIIQGLFASVYSRPFYNISLSLYISLVYSFLYVRVSPQTKAEKKCRHFREIRHLKIHLSRERLKMMKEEEERRSLLLLTTTRSKRSNFSDSFTRFLKRKSSSRSLEDDASSSSSLSSALTGTLSRVMMLMMFLFMFMGITCERTKREGEKGIRFQHQQHLGDTLNTTTDDIAENTSNNTSDKFTFTLYTACSPTVSYTHLTLPTKDSG